MNAIEFITESNRIEGIRRPPGEAEISEFHRFYALEKVTVADLEHFVSVYQPGAVLRYRVGCNVRVGGHYPPPGGPQIRIQLTHLLQNPVNPWRDHCIYEALHPFDDCNGRSGRMYWAWQMQDISLGFLQMYYYQTLREMR